MVSLRRATFIYSIGGFLSKLLFFLINLSLAKLLSPEEYGKTSVLIAFNSFLIAVLPLGFNASFSRLFFDGINHNERINIAGNIFYGWLFLGAFVSVILIIVLQQLSSILFKDIHFYPSVFITVIGGFLFAISVFLRSYYQLIEKALTVIAIDIIDRTLLFGLILFFIIALKLQLESWLIATLITSGCFAILTLYIFSAELRFNFDLSIIKKAWLYSSPLVLHTASGWVLSLSDRLLINSMMSASDVAFYTLPYSIAQGLGLISQATGRGWVPRITKVYVENGEYKRYYGRFIKITFIPLITLGTFLMLFGGELLELFGGNEYKIKSSNILPILISGFVLEGYYRVSLVKFQLEKNLRIVPLITLAASIINIVLNITLIPYYGIIATTMSTFLGFSLLSALTVYRSKSYILFKNEFIKIFVIAFVVLSLASFFSKLDVIYKVSMLVLIIIADIAIIIRIKKTDAPKD